MDSYRMPPPGLTTLPLKPAFQQPFDLKHDDFDLKINISPEYLISKFIAGCRHGVMISPSGLRIPITFYSMQAHIDIHVTPVNTTEIEENTLGFVTMLLGLPSPPPVETVLSEELLAYLRQKLAKTYTKLNISLEINQQFTDQELPFVFAQLQRRIVGILFGKMTGIFADNQKVANACFREEGLKKLETTYPKNNWKPYYNPPHNDHSHKFLRILINRLGLQNVSQSSDENVDTHKFNLQSGPYFNFFISLVHRRHSRPPSPEIELEPSPPPQINQPPQQPLPQLSVVPVEDVKENAIPVVAETALKESIEPQEPQEPPIPQDPLLETHETVKLLKTDEFISDQKLLEIIHILKDGKSSFSTWGLVFEKAQGRYDAEINKELWIVLKKWFCDNLHEVKEKDAKTIKDFWFIVLRAMEFQKHSPANLQEKQKIFIELITNNPEFFNKREITGIFNDFKVSWKKCLDSQKGRADITLYAKCFTEWYDNVLSKTLDVDNVIYLCIEHVYTLLQFQNIEEIEIYLKKLETFLKLPAGEEKHGYITVGQLHMDTLVKQFPKKIISCKDKTDKKNHPLLSQLTAVFIDISIRFKCRSLSGLSGISFLWKSGIPVNISQFLNLIHRLGNESLEEKDVTVINEIQLEDIILDVTKGLCAKIKELQLSKKDDSKEQRELLNIGAFLASIDVEAIVNSRQFLNMFLELYHTLRKDVKDHAKIRVLLELCIRLTKAPDSEKFQEIIRYYNIMIYLYTLQTGDLDFFTRHLSIIAKIPASLKFDKIETNDEEIKAPLFLIFFFSMQNLVAKTESFTPAKLSTIVRMTNIIHSKLRNVLEDDQQILHEYSDRLTRWLVILLSRKEPEFIETISSFRQSLPRDRNIPVKWILNQNWDIVEALFSNTLKGFFDNMLREYFSTRPMQTRLEFRNTLIALYLTHVKLGIPLVQKLEKLVEDSLPYLAQLINEPTIHSYIIYLDPKLYPEDKDGEKQYHRLMQKLEKTFAIIQNSPATTLHKASLMTQVIKPRHTVEFHFKRAEMLDVCMYVFEVVRKLNWHEAVVREGILYYFRNNLKEQKWINAHTAKVAEFALTEGQKVFDETKGDLKCKQNRLLHFLKGEELLSRLANDKKKEKTLTDEQVTVAVREYVDTVTKNVLFNLDVEKYKTQLYSYEGINILSYPIDLIRQYFFTIFTLNDGPYSQYENAFKKLREILLAYRDVIDYLDSDTRARYLNLYVNTLTTFFQHRNGTPASADEREFDVHYIKDIVDLVKDFSLKCVDPDPCILLGILRDGIELATKPLDDHHMGLLKYLENYVKFRKLTIREMDKKVTSISFIQPSPPIFLNLKKLLEGKK